MNNKTKKALKKKLFIAGLFLLSTGTIVSISLSQISFATNSFDNNIKLLSNNNETNQLTTNKSSQKTPLLNNEMIGKRVNGFSPFWKSARLNTKDNYWKTKQNYQYFAANVNPDLNDQFFANPGIAFAWYGNDHSYSYEERPFPSHASAGPGQITFYTRAIEDYYYDYKNNINEVLLNNQNFINDYKEIFFSDISDVQPTKFVDFVNSIISKDTGYGTNNLNQKPYDTSKEGSVLAKLIFNNHLGREGDTSGPNINLNKIVFYPTSYVFNSKDYKKSTLTCDVPVKAPYNTVWIGNEIGQQATGPEFFDEKVNPAVDYNSEKNSALMRAMTLDSLTLRTWQNSYKGKIWQYQATGAIKFRIFYEYDFIRSPKTHDFTYDISDFKNNEGIDLDKYLIYDDTNPDNNAKKVDTNKLKNLIVQNYETMLKNISYTNASNDAMSSESGTPTNQKMMLDPFVNLDPNKVSIGNDTTFQIDPNNPNESSITFNVTIDISPKLTRQLTIKFHSRSETKVKSDTINVNIPDVITPQVDQAAVIKVIQDNLNQIFDNFIFSDKTTAKVVKIDGFDNVSGAKDGIIYVKSITLQPVLILGQRQNQEKTFTVNINGSNQFKIVGYKATNELSTTIEENITLIDTNDVRWSTILAETLFVENPNKLPFVNALKQYLVNNELIKNPLWTNQKIKPEDFNLEIVQFNNTNASAQVKITLLNYYENGLLVNNKPKDIFTNISGFKQLNATSPKTGLVFDIDPQTALKPANLVTNEEILAFIDSKPTTDFLNSPIVFNKNSIEITNNPWVQNTQIRLDPNKQPIPDVDNGTIRVFAQASWYQTSNAGIETEYKSLFEFSLRGFETNQSKLTTIIKDGLLPGVDTILADQLMGTEDELKQAIVNSGLVQNLYPYATEPLSIDDIQLSNLKPKNIDGTLTCDVTINNSKAWTDGIVNQSKIINDVIFNGFKIQNPTAINNNQPINLVDLGLTDMDLNNIQTIFSETIEPTLQQHLDLIVSNQYPNSKVSFEYIPTSIDFAQASLNVNVNITNGIYNQDGNSTPNGSLGPVVIKLVGFFKDVLNTTALNDVMTLTGWESNVASLEVDNPQLIPAIKQLVISDNNLINPNPAQAATVDDVLSVVINSYDNLTGSLNVTIELNKSVCLYNGIVSKANLKQTITINGFKNLQETKIANEPFLDANNQYGINNIVASDISTDPKYLEDIKTAISAESHQIFSNLVFDTNITINDIHLVYKSFNNFQGSALFDITITGGYACDATGTLKDITFSDVNLYGFKQLQAVNIDGNLTLPFNTMQPSDFMNDMSSAITTIKKFLIEQKLKPNMFVYGFPTFDDISITILQIDDKNGQIFIRVEIRNQNYVPQILPQTNQENLNGDVVKWDPNQPNPIVMDAITINGFKYQTVGSDDDWWIITASTVSSVAGTILIVLIILYILRRFVFVG